jgi:hypothetical protein
MDGSRNLDPVAGFRKSQNGKPAVTFTGAHPRQRFANGQRREVFRPLWHTQAVNREISTTVGDHVGIPAVRFAFLPPQKERYTRPVYVGWSEVVCAFHFWEFGGRKEAGRYSFASFLDGDGLDVQEEYTQGCLILSANPGNSLSSLASVSSSCLHDEVRCKVLVTSPPGPTSTSSHSTLLTVPFASTATSSRSHQTAVRLVGLAFTADVPPMRLSLSTNDAPMAAVYEPERDARCVDSAA